MSRATPAARASAPAGELVPTDAILVDREIRALLGSAVRPAPGSAPIDAAQVQPASLDLRLGATAHRIRAGFLPERTPLEHRLAELATSRLSLEGDGAVLERGLTYLVELDETLALSGDLAGRFNPRSSAGRCDLFTRVLVTGHPRFDEAPPGYTGRLWLEVAPLSFPVRLRRGDRLCQLRLQRGAPALSRAELDEVYRRTPLLYERAAPGAAESPIDPGAVRFDDHGGLELTVGLHGRDPCAWRAALHTDVLAFGAERAHRTADFWEPMRAADGHLILDPGRFYLFASRERIRVPPELAAEMVPVDVGIGELRNNYAGFFDCGFGCRTDARGQPVPGGTPAVLEVRAHDLPFLIEHGQTLCRLRFFRASGRPDLAYGQGRAGPSYQDQDLTPARPFR